MKILVTGGNGLVGSHFVQNYNPKENVLFPDSKKLNITDINSVEAFFKNNEIEVVIHFAAFTNVTESEKERDNKNGPCWNINVTGTSNLTQFCKKRNIYFIHISTDSVFSGMKSNPGPYTEDYPPEKNSKLISWYGWTKRIAEEVISNNLSNYAIVRISNPVRAKYDTKLDYARKIISLFDTGKLYPLFTDQYLTLTFIDEVTMCLKVLLEKKERGIFHVSSTNLYTPHKLANFLIEKARKIKNAVKPISTEEFLKDNPSRYPQYGGLNVEKTQARLKLKFNTWEETILSLVKQLST